MASAITAVLGVAAGCQSRPQIQAANGATDHLEKLAGTTAANFERIDNVESPLLKKDIVIPGNKPVTFVGWAVDGSTISLASGVEIVIDGKAYRAHYGDSRPDVAQVLKNGSLNNSGYSLELPAGSLAPGRHEVETRIVTADGKKYFSIGPVRFRVE
jgi:hypothetical protein